MWSGRNVQTFRSTLLPLSSGSLEGFVEIFIAKNSKCGGHALCTSVYFAAEITCTERNFDSICYGRVCTAHNLL